MWIPTDCFPQDFEDSNRFCGTASIWTDVGNMTLSDVLWRMFQFLGCESLEKLNNTKIHARGF